MQKKTNLLLIIIVVSLIISVTYLYIKTVKNGDFEIINYEETI